MQNKKSYTGVLTIQGKKYNCQVVNGVRFVEGQPIDDFLGTLHYSALVELCEAGISIARNEGNSPQQMMDEFHQSKNN